MADTVIRVTSVQQAVQAVRRDGATFAFICGLSADESDINLEIICNDEGATALPNPFGDMKARTKQPIEGEEGLIICPYYYTINPLLDTPVSLSIQILDTHTTQVLEKHARRLQDKHQTT